MTITLPLEIGKRYGAHNKVNVLIQGQTRFADIVYCSRGHWYFKDTGRAVNYTMDGALTREPFPESYELNIIEGPL